MMFVDYVDSGGVSLEELERPEEAGPDPARWLLGELWNCTDIMPGPTCALLNLPQGANYAMGVGQLAKAL
jgi:hypothetical protein